ncbi:hypothetical protein IFR10_05065 [Bacillus sp. CFBP 13597]|nr:hypothetical protein [Bacillus sp. CFBP 13597]
MVWSGVGIKVIVGPVSVDGSAENKYNMTNELLGDAVKILNSTVGGISKKLENPASYQVPG